MASSTTSRSCDPAYPTLCLPIGLGKNTIDCDSAEVGGATNFPVREPDPYGLDSSGVGDGVGCEASTRVLGTSTSAASGDASLAATGTAAPYLGLIAVGTILLGMSALAAIAQPQWLVARDGEVRYTIESVRRRR